VALPDRRLGRCRAEHLRATVYVGSHDEHLYALERESGILLWRQHLGCELSSEAAISMGYVVVAGRDGKVYCFRSRASSGAKARAGFG